MKSGTVTCSRSGHSLRPVFIPLNEALHGRWYKVGGKMSSVPLFSSKVPVVVARKYLLPR